MPVFLSLLVCMGAQYCHVTVPMSRPYVGVSACQIDGMQQAALWKQEHPTGYVQAIRCTLGSKPQAQDNA